MLINKIKNKEFKNIKDNINSFKRMHGYYIIDLISINELKKQNYNEDELLGNIFQYFDDTEWQTQSENITDESWEEYEVEKNIASKLLIESLVGGNEIGHTKDTIPIKKAKKIFEDFDAFFSNEKKYYVNIGLGKKEYVYQNGLVIIDNEKAGIIWIVEND